ncbi:MAG: hypothetical protein IE928_08680 [Gammaproteobacteria bacterium]|nr:hypothetical protein [Gammaproteobacteria bacterium]
MTQRGGGMSRIGKEMEYVVSVFVALIDKDGEYKMSFEQASMAMGLSVDEYDRLIDALPFRYCGNGY